MIYLDNAATGWPKPYTVINAVRSGMTALAANPGRGGYAMSLETAEAVYNVRMLAADFFGASAPENVIFTAGCTHAVNLALTGFLPAGSHVVVSDREHNAVMRPLYALAQRGALSYSVAQIGADTANADRYFEAEIRPETGMLFCIGTSNVTGEMLPLEKIGALAARRGLLFAVDAAQTAGIRKISMRGAQISLLCAAGHKSLYGPMGVGLLIAEGCRPLDALIYGGTGSNSADYAQPDFLPDALESGTLNVPGILGLGEGIRFVRELGEENIFAHENALARRLYAGLSRIRGLKLLSGEPKSNVVSFAAEGVSSEEIARRLAQEDICVRGGLHCAPSAHALTGTLQSGAVRMSFGVYNDAGQLDEVLHAVSRSLR